MTSLLDKVLDSKDNPSIDSSLSPKDDLPHQMADGSIVYDSTISAINRVFEMNPHLYKKQTMRGEHLFNGPKMVRLDNPSEVTELLCGDWEPKTDWQLVFFKKKVMEYAPVLSFDGISVSDYLFWDKKTCTLRTINHGEVTTTI